MNASISLLDENLIHFATAMREFPGRAVCIQTGHRWRLHGVRSANGEKVKLETVLIGGLRYTSREAIARFISAQNAPAPTPAPRLSRGQRQRQALAAMAAAAK